MKVLGELLLSKEPKALYFSWREAILESRLCSTTKLVLLTLGCHMNEFGKSCYPSMETIAHQSSLTVRAVAKHITIAESSGWITRDTHGYSGRGWRRNEYVAAIPEDHERGSSRQVMNVVPNSNERGSCGDEPECSEVMNQVHTSTSRSTPKSTLMNTSRQTEEISDDDMPF